MATYKPYVKTTSGKEEVKMPSSAISGLATVATSGSYNDLSNKPTIPDVSGKANLAGGNTFSGTQTFNLASGEFFKVHGLQVVKGDGVTDVFISPEDTNGDVYIWKPNSDTVVRFGDDGIDIDDDENGDIPIMLQHDAGTSGQVLTSQGASKTPKWTTPAIKSATLTGTTLYLTLG